MRPVLALVVVVCACGGNAPQRPAPKLNRWGKPLVARPAPDWVEKLPQSSRTRIVAVGRSGPTFWPQDALNNAREDARGKIALQLTAHVERYGAATDASGRAARALDIDKEATDVLLRNARIEATWVDEAGERLFGDGRRRAGDRHDLDGGERDQASDGRDQASDRRDHAGDGRARAGGGGRAAPGAAGTGTARMGAAGPDPVGPLGSVLPASR